MDQAGMCRSLKAVIAEIQRDCAREVPPMSDDTRPLADLPGFDSLASVDAEVRLSKLLGQEVDIPFKDQKAKKELSIKEIAETMLRTMEPKMARRWK